MDWTIKTVYLGCAALGGAALVLQLLLLLFGVGHDVDVGADADVDLHGGHLGSGSAFNLLSVRAIAGFLTFFGLTGWAGIEAGWATFATLAAALGAGLAVMLLIAWALAAFRRLDSQGNLVPGNAIGLSARVYLRIPGHNKGTGKITVSVQGRSVEFQAVTSGKELPTGSEVRIVRQTTPNTFEVEPLT
jgi:hypothetical protein